MTDEMFEQQMGSHQNADNDFYIAGCYNGNAVYDFQTNKVKLPPMIDCNFYNKNTDISHLSLLQFQRSNNVLTYIIDCQVCVLVYV